MDSPDEADEMEDAPGDEALSLEARGDVAVSFAILKSVLESIVTCSFLFCDDALVESSQHPLHSPSEHACPHLVQEDDFSPEDKIKHRITCSVILGWVNEKLSHVERKRKMTHSLKDRREDIAGERMIIIVIIIIEYFVKNGEGK